MGFGLGVIGASALPDLYRNAQLCLLAARPVGYVNGQHWHNHGTTGTTCDAWPVSITHHGYLPPGATYTAPNGDPLPGPGFVAAAADQQHGTFSERMFEISGVPLTPADDTKPFTATIAFTPLHLKPSGMRFAWKYQCSSLPPSPPGLVIENINDHPIFGPGNYLPAAAYNGRTSPVPTGCCFSPPTPGTTPCTGDFDEDDQGNFLGALAQNFIEHTRQVVSFRYDPVHERTATGWRNSLLIPPAVAISNDGPWLDASNLRIGAGQICHAVLWHDRALTDDEIALLHTRLAAR